MAAKRIARKIADKIYDDWANACVKADAPLMLSPFLATRLDRFVAALEDAEKAVESTKGYPTPESQRIEKIRLAVLKELAGE